MYSFAAWVRIIESFCHGPYVTVQSLEKFCSFHIVRILSVDLSIKQALVKSIVKHLICTFFIINTFINHARLCYKRFNVLSSTLIAPKIVPKVRQLLHVGRDWGLLLLEHYVPFLIVHVAFFAYSVHFKQSTWLLWPHFVQYLAANLGISLSIFCPFLPSSLVYS